MKKYKSKISSCCKASVERIKISKDHLIDKGDTNGFFYVCSNCGQEVEE